MNIEFIFETEDSINFSFLDVKNTHKNKRFVTSTFCKATFCGVFTNYNIFLFDTYKMFSPQVSFPIFRKFGPV